MSESVEIEYKSLLTATDYQKLIDFYQLTAADFFSQTNAYYDTATGRLQKAGWGLRIRLYSDYGEATLKTPLTDGLLETTDKLSLAEASTYVEAGKFLSVGHTVKKMQELAVTPAELEQIAQLTTKRAEFKIPEGLLAIDHSFYSGQEDFEVELEVTDVQIGQQAFRTFLQKFDIPYKKADNKIKRAFLAANLEKNKRKD
ncbi:CYTH domain-containing protein [Enterococcus sp. LJL120]